MLLEFQPKPLYYRKAKVQSMKSFAFISLYALDLAKGSSWARIRDDQSPRQSTHISLLNFYWDTIVTGYIIPPENVLVPQKVFLTFYIAQTWLKTGEIWKLQAKGCFLENQTWWLTLKGPEYDYFKMLVNCSHCTLPKVVILAFKPFRVSEFFIFEFLVCKHICGTTIIKSIEYLVLINHTAEAAFVHTLCLEY